MNKELGGSGEKKGLGTRHDTLGLFELGLP